jgi:16S rRNA (guanine527-N7)-methyltransferase
MSVSRETEEAFRPYCELLRKWTSRINLVAPSTTGMIYERHILDCLKVVPLIPENARSAIDLGSGAGLPGLVVAAAMKGQGRSIHVTLVEADKRKCAFLAEAARVLDVQVDIEATRILDLPSLAADVVMARALAPLTELLVYQRHHGAPSSRGIYMKGARHAEEIRQALDEGWDIDMTTYPGTAPDAANLVVKLRKEEV